MAIKIIDSMPRDKKASTREQIEADIKEALENDIHLFEFVGDYNFKHLGEYARSVVDRIRAKKVHEIQQNFKNEYFTEEQKNIKGFHIWFKPSYDYRRFEWIKIHTHREKETGQMRVFCKIGDTREFEELVFNDCKKEYNEQSREYEIVDGKWQRKR